MTRYLSLSVSFLDPFFHGQGEGVTEWPPSPLRLYQALVAGAHAGCRANEWTGADDAAFRWLEERDPPSVVAPLASGGSNYVFYVPNNDSDKVRSRQDRLTSKVARPQRLIDGDTVRYLWPIEEPDWAAAKGHTDVLREQARRLLALGWGVDQVVGNGEVLSGDDAAQQLPGVRWEPLAHRSPADRAWRIPVKGTLDDLDRVHRSFVERLRGGTFTPPLEASCFSSVTYLPVGSLPARPHAVFELPEGVAFRQEDVAKVAAMLRSLAIRTADSDTHEFPGGTSVYVAGHAGKSTRTPERFSFLPLPTIGHRNADGMIRRLLIAEPFGGEGTHAGWARSRLLSSVLRDEDGSDRGVLLGLWRQTSPGLVQRYLGPVRTWSTVTPVVLPGFDDGKYSKAQGLLATALEQAEIPADAVEDAVMRKAPLWPGSQHPRHYFVPNYLRGRSRWHVRLVFREPVGGPIAVGAGRHAGLGLFAAVEE